MRAYVRALAMQRLEIPTSIEGIAWDSLMPRRALPLQWRLRYDDFRPRASATTEALAFLRARGVDVPDVLHDPYAEAHPPPRIL